MSSRWADEPEDAALVAQRKREKEAKKALKIAKQRAQDVIQQQKAERNRIETDNGDTLQQPNAKRRRTSEPVQSIDAVVDEASSESYLLRHKAPTWSPSRSTDDYEQLNHIESGTYGTVSRGRDRRSGRIVAIKRMKPDEAGAGVPVTTLREIETLSAVRGHVAIVDLIEVVIGPDPDATHARGHASVANEQISLVLEFVEHDLKTLMEDMDEGWKPSEVKTLMLQLASALEFLHDRWILHRDLKTSNVLINNRGQIKLADFGMARFTASPPPANLTSLVVTLWYRSPELLLGATQYDEKIDMWSLGCIFGELLTGEPILRGKNEVDQLARIFALCGIPDENSWPGFRRLPNSSTLKLPRRASGPSMLEKQYTEVLAPSGMDLLSSLLSLDPAKRPTAKEVLSHGFFKEDPRPKSTAMFPTFPSKAGQERRRRRQTPDAPVRGRDAAAAAIDFSDIFAKQSSD